MLSIPPAALRMMAARSRWSPRISLNLVLTSSTVFGSPGVDRRLVQPVGVHEASHGHHLGQVIVRTEAGHMCAQQMGGLPHAVAVHAADP